MPHRRWWILALLGAVAIWGAAFGPAPSVADPETSTCVSCHEKIQPGIVAQWRASRHASLEKTVGCDTCHGDDHQSADDVEKARDASPKVCKRCHFTQVKQFEKGKHALAMAAVTAIPMLAMQPEPVQAMACLGCHEIGRAWEDGSTGRCDACHTRHLFSKDEAKQPEACETCHMGEDHSQYEMWSSSKHGVIHRTMPEMERAPVCQTCHMPDGLHAVKTGWGFLGLRLPVPDQQWQEDTMTIVKAIGPWGRDEEGMKARVEAIQALGIARLDEVEFQEIRATMTEICARCHARAYVREHFEHADGVVRETTHLLAQAVGVVEGLYEDGILPRTEDGPEHVDLLLFYESPTEIEQELYRMFLFHRQKAFQGAMHANPDYMHWYGWAPMKSSFQRIQALAQELRAAEK